MLHEEYLGQYSHLVILGEKLNGFKPAKSLVELQKHINIAKEWIKKHPGEPYNFYKS